MIRRPVNGFLKRDQLRVDDVGVGAKHLLGLDHEQLSKLVGKTLAFVVRLRFEGHAQHCHDFIAKLLLLSKLTTMKLGKPSFTSMAECPRKKLLPENAESCNVSFSRQGPAAKPALAKLLMRG